MSEKEMGICTGCKKECDNLSQVGSRGPRRVTLCEDCIDVGGSIDYEIFRSLEQLLPLRWRGVVESS